MTKARNNSAEFAISYQIAFMKKLNGYSAMKTDMKPDVFNKTSLNWTLIVYYIILSKILRVYNGAEIAIPYS